MVDIESKKTNFGQMVIKLAKEKGLTQVKLAMSVDRNPAYLNHIVTGFRLPTPHWVEDIANALGVDEDMRRGLHKAAAMDQGFKLD